MALAFVSWMIILHSPSMEVPVESDALVVLATFPESYPKAVELMRQNTAPVLLVSAPAPRSIIPKGLCDHPQGFEVICTQPLPVTTLGEGIMIRDIATKRGWNTVSVLTVQPHSRRARMILNSCWNGNLHIIPYVRETDLTQKIYTTLYETGAWIKALGNPSCKSRDDPL